MAKGNITLFETLVKRADAAGMAAVETTVVTPMVVTKRSNPLNDASPIEKAWVVPDGVCGFAGVKIRPATTPFARWMKATGRARSAYGGGLETSVFFFNQSLTRKEAYATAYAKVLADAGISAYAWSRMD